MKIQVGMGSGAWNEEDRAMVAAVLGARAFDYLLAILSLVIGSLPPWMRRWVLQRAKKEKNLKLLGFLIYGLKMRPNRR
ncbi:transcription factor bHLH13 [Corchorus olitorius]|uniref:Transcription factor bHLH13 n=1 Tax=Corchorus olitorius TaxID=93759 RepID=A0A1R3J0B2_9ROSI|nr:transcription factor bHLH13 [Corchorus olitorius]